MQQHYLSHLGSSIPLPTQCPLSVSPCSAENSLFQLVPQSEALFGGNLKDVDSGHCNERHQSPRAGASAGRETGTQRR